MSPVKVRLEEPGDVEAIHAVHVASFPSAVEAELVEALRRSGRLEISVVAEEAGRIVAHVAFSPVRIAGREIRPPGLGLAPLATLEAYRRRGIGAALVRTGLQLAWVRGHGFCVVLGDPSYYARFGFQPASHFKLRDEYGGGNAFQALELLPGTLPAAGGLVQYAPEFAAVD